MTSVTTDPTQDPRMSGAGKPPSLFDGGLQGFLRRKEVRAVLYQVLAVTILFAAFAWMGNNVVINLKALGKDFSFEFLGQASNYDINQRPIEYDSQSTHGRAMLIGIINTGLVAVVGIVFASIIGLLVAIARLSPNWLLSRLAYAFTEFVRNVPVLLHILLVYGVVITVLPNQREGEEPFTLFDRVILSNRGLFIPKPEMHEGAGLLFIAFLVACALSYLWRRYAKVKQAQEGKTLPVFLPSLALIVLLPFFMWLATPSSLTFSLPEQGRFNIQQGLRLLPEFFALTLALAIYTSAFIAEVIRAGILSVSKGQKEAAGALGFSRLYALRLIILPQALRVAVPPITNQYLNLTKNSSLAIAIGYQDIVGTIGGITLNQTGREMECMILVLLLYLSFSLFISFLMNIYNRSIALVER